MSDVIQNQPETPERPAGIVILEQEVKTRLEGRVQDFRIQLGKRGFILTGKAKTYYAKQLAQHHASTLAPASSFVEGNDIEVA